DLNSPLATPFTSAFCVAAVEGSAWTWAELLNELPVLDVQFNRLGVVSEICAPRWCESLPGSLGEISWNNGRRRNPADSVGPPPPPREESFLIPPKPEPYDSESDDEPSADTQSKRSKK
ncbi:MAG: hypothetical protein ACKN9U_21445, partial [Pirellulaceae bacterium]